MFSEKNQNVKMKHSLYRTAFLTKFNFAFENLRDDICSLWKSWNREINSTIVVVLVNSFIVSRVDYCNSILAGLPTCQLDRIQSVLNATARLLYDRTPSDNRSAARQPQLHVPQRIVYNLCLVTYKALNDHHMPDYISDFCIIVADKMLRSS